LITFFALQNNIPIVESLKTSIMGFAPEILNMYFLKLPNNFENTIKSSFFVIPELELIF